MSGLREGYTFASARIIQLFRILFSFENQTYLNSFIAVVLRSLSFHLSSVFGMSLDHTQALELRLNFSFANVLDFSKEVYTWSI